MKLYVLLSDEDCVGSGFFQGVYLDKTEAELEALRLNESEEANAAKFNMRQTTVYNVEEVESKP